MLMIMTVVMMTTPRSESLVLPSPDCTLLVKASAYEVEGSERKESSLADMRSNARGPSQHLQPF